MPSCPNGTMVWSQLYSNLKQIQPAWSVDSCPIGTENYATMVNSDLRIADNIQGNVTVSISSISYMRNIMTLLSQRDNGMESVALQFTKATLLRPMGRIRRDDYRLNNCNNLLSKFGIYETQPTFKIRRQK
jgi:hypothetical protein